MIELKINGQPHSIDADPDMPLLWALRELVGLTGTKFGCGMAQCGACTVHVNGEPTRSCVTPVSAIEGKRVVTIEYLPSTTQGNTYRAVRQAWIDKDVVQCGYCQSGQIMSAVALLKEPCGPADADVKEMMSGNICRCGAYGNIVAAIQQVRKNS